jgi:hypothetical protein
VFNKNRNYFWAGISSYIVKNHFIENFKDDKIRSGKSLCQKLPIAPMNPKVLGDERRD